MLHEFFDRLKEVKKLFEHTDKIAKNEAVDDVDLAPLELPQDSLASDCFSNSNGVKPLRYLAQREAYDFCAAHKRIPELWAHDRKWYYEETPKTNEKIVASYTLLSSVLERFDLQVGDA